MFTLTVLFLFLFSPHLFMFSERNGCSKCHNYYSGETKKRLQHEATRLFEIISAEKERQMCTYVSVSAPHSRHSPLQKQSIHKQLPHELLLLFQKNLSDAIWPLSSKKIDFMPKNFCLRLIAPRIILSLRRWHVQRAAKCTLLVRFSVIVNAKPKNARHIQFANSINASRFQVRKLHKKHVRKRGSKISPIEGTGFGLR